MALDELISAAQAVGKLSWGIASSVAGAVDREKRHQEYLEKEALRLRTPIKCPLCDLDDIESSTHDVRDKDGVVVSCVVTLKCTCGLTFKRTIFFSDPDECYCETVTLWNRRPECDRLNATISNLERALRDAE